MDNIGELASQYQTRGWYWADMDSQRNTRIYVHPFTNSGF